MEHLECGNSAYNPRRVVRDGLPNLEDSGSFRDPDFGWLGFPLCVSVTNVCLRV